MNKEAKKVINKGVSKGISKGVNKGVSKGENTQGPLVGVRLWMNPP